MDKGTEEIAQRSNDVRRMFDNIADKYDLLNRLISLGQDRKWRRETVQEIAKTNPKKILDLAAGTGDLSLSLAKASPKAHITAGDISQSMLLKAQEKAQKKGVQSISTKICNALDLPFEDESFDAITCAFGVRNFADIPKGLSEMFRCLEKGGVVAILELCEPLHPLVKKGYRLHAFKFIPWLGEHLGGDRSAYKYLPKSIQKVPQHQEMVDLMRSIGFEEVHYRLFTLGVCALYVGKKL